MGIWNSSPHPVSDIRDWQRSGRLEVRPSFQRKEVWSPAARIMLIDTILRQVPMPKMFLWNEVVNESTHRRVIDGQQRISAILGFLDDKFALESPYSGPYVGKKFSELPIAERQRILQYRIDFNEALDFDEAEVREVYSRVNKYSLPLNKQELRKADYPGIFLEVSTELSLDDYLENAKVFSIAQRRRMGDVEFMSEVLAGMLEGPQDKKGDLDYFYSRYAHWGAADATKAKQEFQAALQDIKLVFDEQVLPLRSTRFRQKSDFYSLFLSFIELRRAGCKLEGKDLVPLRQDLKLLDQYIAPESPVDILSEYAIKCVSQANSVSSRSWRKNFLLNILAGTYRQRRPDSRTVEMFTTILVQLQRDEGSLLDVCSGCDRPMSEHEATNRVLEWPKDAASYQITNSCWRAASCPASGST
ncbi:DUF262 domain-containing protein [Mesorhizobium escarrei]|uniref:GmrSD restriction endonucleases N-terminal domain-containing protein n=1 Tax=Mesorhizobium escarrei TaxID=666018 RepID=A0ABN8K0J9_9HYPH|nr:DUF262 domain-containing protein [Mesorhizobium escarrei]CAH2403008.1 conserved hypothetical protein [Mesorhizobium escarrei]